MTANGGRRGPIRVVVLDDHPAVRLGLQRVLEREPGLLLCAVVADEEGLRAAVAAERPDVVLLDYDLGSTDGLTLCQQVKQRPDPPAVVIYSAFASPALAIPAALAQADGLLDKVLPVDTLLDAIRRVVRGEWIGPKPPAEMLRAAGATIEPDDLPVLSMLVERVTPAEIAQTLGIQPTDVLRRAQRMRGRLLASRH